MMRHLGWTVGLFLVLGLGGCNIIGAAASAVGGDNPKDPEPTRYEGLAGQTCAVMVWADRSITIDFPQIRADMASALQSKLVEEGQGKLGRSQLKDTKFPFPATSMVRFQDEHRDMMLQPITQAVLRPKIEGLSRVIYIEIVRMETRYPQSRELYRGAAEAKLRVVEIKDGQSAKVAFEDTIEVHFPQKGLEALPQSDTVDDQHMYTGTVAVLAHEVSRRFYPPEEK